jgi:hypothetical protein
MQGDVDRDANHVAKLTVRANDGSNFWFDEIRIQYELVPTSVVDRLGSARSSHERRTRARI